MKACIIDSSAGELALAVIDGENTYEYVGNAGARRHTSEILVQLDELFKKAEIDARELDYVGVVVGPGSFTGVRSSISAARVFNIACPNLNVGGISAFDAYINVLSEDELAEINAVIIETRRDDFYVQIFDLNYFRSLSRFIALLKLLKSDITAAISIAAVISSSVTPAFRAALR